MTVTTWTPRCGEGVEVDGERGDQRLAFAGLHLGDLALVQDHAADHLHVEMALPERAPGRLAHGGEGGHQQVVEIGAVGELLAERLRAGPQLGVGELLQLGLERVDLAPTVGRYDLILRSLADPKTLAASAPKDSISPSSYRAMS